MEKLEQELKEKLERILHIYLNAKDAFHYMEYLYFPNTEEEKELFNNSVYKYHFRSFQIIFFRSFIIELHKLYSNSKNDKFSLIKFINLLKLSGRYKKINFPIDQVDFWVKEIDNSQNTIKKIIFLRDKLYAHSDDPKMDFSKYTPYIKDLARLMDLTEGIIVVLYQIINRGYLDPNLPHFKKQEFNMFKLLADAEKRRKEEIHERFINSINKNHQ